MNVVLQILNVVLPTLYAVTVLAYALDFFRADAFARRAERPLLVAAILLHVLHLLLRTAVFAHPPVASIFEVMSCVALAVALVYAYVEIRSRNHTTGMFLLTVSLLFQTASSAFIPATSDFPRILQSPLFGVHTGSAILGYAAFAVSAVYGVLYLCLYHELKSSRFSVIYRRLPSLEVLSRMSVRAAAFGLACLAFTIGFGMLWASREFPGFTRDPKFFLSIVCWGIYAMGVGLHYSRRWQPRRTIYVFLFGFSLMLLSAAAAKLWLHSFHGFA